MTKSYDCLICKDTGYVADESDKYAALHCTCRMGEGAKDYDESVAVRNVRKPQASLNKVVIEAMKAIIKEIEKKSLKGVTVNAMPIFNAIQALKLPIADEDMLLLALSQSLECFGTFEYSPDCPACLRNLTHSYEEHGAALQRVFESSVA